MTIDLHIQYVIRNGEGLSNTQIHNKIIENVHIGKLPIMLRSSICVLSQYKHLNNRQTGECEYDAGGYFIINGSEKTVWVKKERLKIKYIASFFLKALNGAFRQKSNQYPILKASHQNNSVL